MLKKIRLDLGELEIFAFNDFVETQNAREFFPSVNDCDWRKYRRIYSSMITEDLILDPFTYYCYVIRDGEHTILVDNGVGGGEPCGRLYEPEWQGCLMDEMASVGILPSDITDVVFTHFHADHVGWATVKTDNGYVKTFPNAVYIAQRAAYDAYHDGITSGAFPAGCFEECIQPLYDRGEIMMIDQERMKLSDNVFLEKREGHTPGAMCVIAESDGRTAVFAGDCIANPLQITDPDQDYIWDIDKALAASSKKKILELYGKQGNVIAGCHFGIGEIEESDDMLIWKEIEQLDI